MFKLKNNIDFSGLNRVCRRGIRVQGFADMGIFNGFRVVFALATLLVLSNCADYKKKQEWGNIDYSKVRNRDTYENDGNYRLPNVTGCTDDDLYNCK